MILCSFCVTGFLLDAAAVQPGNKKERGGKKKGLLSSCNFETRRMATYETLSSLGASKDGISSPGQWLRRKPSICKDYSDTSFPEIRVRILCSIT